MPGRPFLLSLNAGSSTLKASLFEADASGSVAEVEGRSATIDRAPGAETLDEAVRALGISGPEALRAVGHRVVHGGTEFRYAVRVDGDVKAAIARLAPLAPLHHPPALAVVEASERRFPGVPQVAAFDTAFFSELPPEAVVYPVPYAWYERWGVRRFGFHGLSHAYCSGRAAAMLGREPRSRPSTSGESPSGLRVVVVHLGNGCSASAVVGGKPVATTMGFTPMEGLMMGTRSGSIDPGILLYLLRQGALTVDELDDALNHQSGLLGISGRSGDFRAVEAAARAGEARARLALAVYARRVREAIGSLAAAMDGIDALVFTAGVGEHAATLRADVCRGLDFLGIRIDRDRNAGATPDADISATDSRARTLVIHTREDFMVAREAVRLAP